MRITQQDIARISQVSQATVSRVLSGDMRVDASLRERVLKIMQDSNYRPDVRARSLRSKRTHLIGLVINRAMGALGEDPFFAGLVAEIIDYLRGSPYHLCVDAASSGPGQASVYDEMLRSRRVDGLILVEPEARDQRLERLQEDHFPFVLLGTSPATEDIYSVDNDNALAGEMATQHLLEQGYQRIGIIGARAGVTVSDDRIAGYQKALRGMQSEELIWHADFGLAPAKATAKVQLRMPNRPDAVVVIDDYMAMGVISAAKDLGIRIPQDLGIVSFNDSAVCNLLEGGLSSVSMRIPDLVRYSCNKLIRVIEHDLMIEKRTIVPCELRARQSSQRQPRLAS